MLNKYQGRMPPGSEAARRCYCTCPEEAGDAPPTADTADRYTPVFIEGEAYLVRSTCPLHGDDPNHQLPEGA